MVEVANEVCRVSRKKRGEKNKVVEGGSAKSSSCKESGIEKDVGSRNVGI